MEDIERKPSVTPSGAVKHSVIIVADKGDLRTFLRIGLEQVGHMVHEAHDPDGAVEICRRHPFSVFVFLVDMAWSKGTFSRLLFDLRAHASAAQIVVILRGDTANEHRLIAKSFGVQQFLSTPFSYEDLALAVRMDLSVSEQGLIQGGPPA